MKITVVAPSACVDQNLIQLAQDGLAAFEVKTQLADHTFAQHRYLAGTVLNKTVDLKAAMEDQSVDAIWCARGGTGAAQLLPFLDKWLLSKPLIGYSDSTVLLNYIAMQGGTAIHGPVFQEIAHRNINHAFISTDAQEVLALLQPVLNHQQINYPIQPANDAAKTVAHISGHVLGGNLTTLCSLQGTPWSLELKQDTILCIEDVGEPFYRLERLLIQLLQSIDTSKLKAVVMGDFHQCPQKNVPHRLEEIFNEHLAPLDVALYTADWFGHGEQNRPFWIGKHAVIQDQQLMI